MSLAEFNKLDDAAARQALLLCCVSERWVRAMLDARPFASDDAFRAQADRCWAETQERDWLEAFEGHPKIGDVDSLKAKYANSGSLAAHEQASVADADGDVINRLAEGNASYEARFGFIFIVCATGKTAREMCELLEARLANDRAVELTIAAEEQRKIMQLRLEKLL